MTGPLVDLTGRTVLVAGSSRGIGAAAARAAAGFITGQTILMDGGLEAREI